MRQDFKDAIRTLKDLWLKRPELRGKVNESATVLGMSKSRVSRAGQFLSLAPSATPEQSWDSGTALCEPEELTLTKELPSVFRKVERQPVQQCTLPEILETVPLRDVLHHVAHHMLAYARVIERFDPVKGKILRAQAETLEGMQV